MIPNRKPNSFDVRFTRYQPPNRPDVSWDLMKEHNAKMDALKQEAKFNLKGKPGNFSLGWQKNLGATPEY